MTHDESNDYHRIAEAIAYLERNFREQPGLDEIAAVVGLSSYHFQRMFRRWAGVTPKQFLQFLTLEYAKSLLEESRDLLTTSYDVGLSGPGRLHDLFVTLEAVTPGQFKERGKKVEIGWAVSESPFGKCLLGVTDRGICFLSFLVEDDGGNREARLAKLKKNWPLAVLREDPVRVQSIVRQVFQSGNRSAASIPLLVRGTNFQVQVWRALLAIPSGSLWSYEQLARSVGNVAGVRAVASAVGANPVSLLIPCHRVIRKSGFLGGYDGGLTRKKALIAWEASRRQREEADTRVGTL